MYAPLNPIPSSAFSVSPFTRAHICRPFAFVPAPDTYTNVIPRPLPRNTARAAASVMSYVTLRYSASFIPTADTPRQKKHASYPANALSIPEKS